MSETERAIAFAVFLILVSPLIWWLMWREDFEGMRSAWNWRHNQRTRARLTPGEFYEEFYRGTEVAESTVKRLLALHESVFEVEAGLIRPQDNFGRIFDRDCTKFVAAIENEFGVKLTDDELETIDGSFDSIARYLDRHCV